MTRSRQGPIQMEQDSSALVPTLAIKTNLSFAFLISCNSNFQLLRSCNWFWRSKPFNLIYLKHYIFFLNKVDNLTSFHFIFYLLRHHSFTQPLYITPKAFLYLPIIQAFYQQQTWDTFPYWPICPHPSPLPWRSQRRIRIKTSHIPFDMSTFGSRPFFRHMSD